MRALLVLSCTLGLSLSACSMFGGHSEKTQSGYVGTASLDQDHVAQTLRDHGYTNVTDLHMNGTHWLGSATTPAGQTANFDIDKDGVIRTK